MTMVVGTDPPTQRENKAGTFGVSAVVFYGLLCVVTVFVAAFFWMNGDGRLAAVLGVGSLAIPVTAGFFVSEFVHQRAGALVFVLVAAVVIGAAGASAYYESDDYFAERDFYHPEDARESRSLGDEARDFLSDLTDIGD